MATSDVIINLRVQALQAKKELKDTKARMKEVQRSASKGSAQMKKSYTEVAKAQETARKSQEALNQKISKQFPAWALSVMFFGMVVHRTMSSIWRASSATFQDISHSVEGTVTQFDHLNGAMTWLKFVAGSALEPIAGMLFPIVMAMADWVEGNQELVRQLTIVVGLIGTVSAVFGGARVAAAGFARAGQSLAAAFAAFQSGGTIMKGLTGIAAALGTGIAGAIAAVTGVVVVAVALWMSNFAGFKDFIQGTFSAIWGVISGTFTDLWTMVRGVFGIITSFVSGEWEQMFEHLLEVGRASGRVLGRLFMSIGAVIFNTIAFAINAVVAVVQRKTDFILFLMQKAFATAGLGGRAAEVANARADLARRAGNLQIDFLDADSIQRGVDKMPGQQTTVNNITNEINIGGNELGQGGFADGEWLAERVSQHMLRELEARGQ